MTVWKSIKGLRCKVCNEIIPDFSVFVEDQSYRKDMSFINGWLINYDREYTDRITYWKKEKDKCFMVTMK